MAAREKVRAGMMELGHQKGKQKVVDCSGETEDPWKQERKAQQTLEQREMQEPQKMATATAEGKGQPRHLHSAGSDLAPTLSDHSCTFKKYFHSSDTLNSFFF